MGVPKLSSEEYQKLAGIVGRSKGEQFMTLDAQRISRASKYTPLSDVIAMGPVSYTHLDVYKRQLLPTNNFAAAASRER